MLAGHDGADTKPAGMDDSAYGTGERLARLAEAGSGDVNLPPARGRDGRFGDRDAGTVTCPAGKVTAIRASKG